MILQKRWGFGTIFSLIAVYFIYLYSKSQEWRLLAFISKWYLIIVGGLIALSLGIMLLVILFSLFMIMLAMLKLKKSKFDKRHKKAKDYMDAEYIVKELNEQGQKDCAFAGWHGYNMGYAFGFIL